LGGPINGAQGKVAVAYRYQQRQIQQAANNGYTLPPLTQSQLELEALTYYGNGAVSAGPYLVPNSTYTGWVVNTNDQPALNYENSVFSQCANVAGQPNCL
jgi:hypothetical protein